MREHDQEPPDPRELSLFDVRHSWGVEVFERVEGDHPTLVARLYPPSLRPSFTRWCPDHLKASVRARARRIAGEVTGA